MFLDFGLMKSQIKSKKKCVLNITGMQLQLHHTLTKNNFLSAIYIKCNIRKKMEFQVWFFSVNHINCERYPKLIQFPSYNFTSLSIQLYQYFRYRKFNLFGEPGFNITDKAELSVFDTDFGVRFGLATCFDIYFHDPIIKLVKELGITDIAFPVAWFSELPFLTGEVMFYLVSY